MHTTGQGSAHHVATLGFIVDCNEREKKNMNHRRQGERQVGSTFRQITEFTIHLFWTNALARDGMADAETTRFTDVFAADAPSV